LTGLRLAELRGLRWEDFDGKSLKTSRTVWRTRIGETKTPESEGSVPVLPVLQRVLNDYKIKIGGKDGEWIFKGEKRGTSLNLANLVRRSITPMLTRCAVCNQMKAKHKVEHEFVLNTKIPQWRGWHSFRRGIGVEFVQSRRETESHSGYTTARRHRDNASILRRASR
jgi:integrase